MNPNSKTEPVGGSHLRDKVRNLVRDELLQAAEAVFAAEGLQTAKVESIAARAGVSVGTVYNYFADRKALVDAVMEFRRNELFRRLEEISARTEGRPCLERLDGVLETILEYFHRQRPYFLLMLQAEGSVFKQSIASSHDPCQGPFGTIFVHFQQLVEQGVREGLMRTDESPWDLAMFLYGICKGMGLSSLTDPTQPDVRLKRPTILRFFLHGAGPLPLATGQVTAQLAG